jgi:hypothetical protein
MLEQGLNALGVIPRPEPYVDTISDPLDLLAFVDPTSASITSTSASIASMTVPPEYHFGLPFTDLLIAILAGGLALCIAYIVWYVLTANGLHPPPRWLGGKHRHHHHRNYRSGR